MSFVDTTPITPIENIDWLPADSSEFNRLVELRQQYKEIEETHKKQREELDKRIEAMLLLAGADRGPLRLQSGYYVVQRVTNGGTPKLDKQRLLELGVSANVIREATTEGKPYSYVLIKPVKE